MGALSLVAGIVCIVISIIFFIPDLKKAKFAKEKWQVFFEFVIDPLGLTSLFYLGLLLILFGLLKVLNLL